VTIHFCGTASLQVATVGKGWNGIPGIRYQDVHLRIKIQKHVKILKIAKIFVLYTADESLVHYAAPKPKISVALSVESLTLDHRSHGKHLFFSVLMPI